MLRLKRKMNVMLFCALIFAGSIAISQTQEPTQQQISVPDAELQLFAKAYQGIQVAQQDAQRKMIAVLEEQEIEIDVFNEIQQAKLQNQEIEAAQSDVQKHAKAVEKIEKMQPEIQSKMEKIITDTNLAVEKYEQIAGALQSNPDLVKRLQKLMAG
ncbi:MULTISPECIES: DUF4168 domain-containing protein [unclassified Arenibacter]|jgi:hypothetical protein|uniref:DUF4168 domain-containing protein n=1 Tax=unclassified Arenibacter TaxID=2615047 RepID=UPI000E356A80|nr:MULTISPECIES: DUF4168 domain-containing protein [unclassified Arenibacter]MCM4165568.1 hypothetical protein [Arenibacter sp. A80]RFT54720.1 DUF4168 domain-containing protein [Arenibacter sp. P308M17]